MPAKIEVTTKIASLFLNPTGSPDSVSLTIEGISPALLGVNVNFLFPGTFARLWKVMGTTSVQVAEWDRVVTDTEQEYPISAFPFFGVKADKWIITLSTPYAVADSEFSNLTILYED